MRIIFDRGTLTLQVDAGDALHAQSLATWHEACAKCETCIETLPSDEIDPACQKLADAATRALTLGRDNDVIRLLREVDQTIRDADARLRNTVVVRGMSISAISVAIGCVLGGVWILIEPKRPWLLLPHGLDLSANYIALILGWSGFTLVGFSMGWLFMLSGAVRSEGRDGVLKHALSLQSRAAQVAYNLLFSVIVVILMFFFGGFEKIEQELSTQLISAPWAVLLGLFAGIAEPVLFERVRGIFKVS